ncbi:MAG TPA: VCBS repeat-containing protein, partial [Acidimicrobiia bacterium]|nr:VCBS repeat-containing protein [Acidimicrobiia bacterium]
MSISRFAGALVGALLFSTATARAQSPVAPMGAQNVALGPGTGVTAPVSPTGGVAASVPLSLPAARGGVPVPLSIIYTGSARVGAAGAGWDIPLSYVRVSSSATRRKPSVSSSSDLQGVVGEQITVTLGGATTIMVPRSGSDVWIPAVGSEYEELAAVPQGWELRTASGLIYTFTIQDRAPEITLLSDIRDVAGHDHVRLGYATTASCRSGYSPETNLTSLEYGTRADDTALYRVELSYGPWFIDNTISHCPVAGAPSTAMTLGRDPVTSSRASILNRVAVLSYDNLAASATARKRVRQYELTYQPDPDTAMPRLSSVAMRGEQGLASDPLLPVATYTYGASTDGNSLVFSPAAEVFQGYGAIPNIGAHLATTAEQRYPATIDPHFPIPSEFRIWIQESRAASHVVRDFTGDGLPDVIWKDGDTWHMRRGQLVGGVATLDATDYTWNDFPEISAEVTYRTDPVTTDTWVEFMDWNGDGRMDVVSAIGVDVDHWRVWLNQGIVGTHLTWKAIDAPVANLRKRLYDEGRLYLPEVPSEVLPLERAKTAPRFSVSWCVSGHWYRTQFLGVAYDAWYASPCTQSPDIVDERHVDTISEWSLRDVNGDGYPDFDLGAAVAAKSSHDSLSPGFGLECLGREPENTFPKPIDNLGTQYEVQYTCTRIEQRWIEPKYVCPTAADPNESCSGAYWNVIGPLDTTSPVAFTGQATGVGDWWVNGVPDSTAMDMFNPNPSYEASGRIDSMGDGLPNYIASDEYGSVHQIAFDSNRDALCTPGAPADTHYQTWQVAGYADLNGDGIPDWLGRELIVCPGGDCTKPPSHSGVWRVRFGTGGGLGPARVIAEDAATDFQLSYSDNTCGVADTAQTTAAITTAGLLDVDGDGKPELVHVTNGKFLVRRILSPGGGPAAGGQSPLASGRLITVSNGDGATVAIDYFNNKDGRATPLPFPEIVVSAERTTLPSGAGDQVASSYFAYDGAALAYDPYSSRWAFPGYLKQLTLASASQGTPYAGTLVVSERSSVVIAPQVWSHLALNGRPQRVSRYEGQFAATGPGGIRDLLSSLVDTDPRLRAHTELAWGLRPLPTDDVMTDADQCEVIAADGTFPSGDAFLCKRAGIVYVASTLQWEGTAAPPSTSNVQSGSVVTQVDQFGRPTQVTLLGDTRRTDDDLCETIDYAAPSTADPTFTAGVTSAVRAVHTTDCGWTNPTWVGTAAGGHWSAGTPIFIGGERFAYDGLPEGQLSIGRPTTHTIERYDVGSGAPMGSSSEKYWYDAKGNVSNIERSRVLGTAATQSTSINYDPWAATPMGISVSATNASTMVATSQTSTWPSVPENRAGVNADATVVERDGFGRPRKVTRFGTDGAAHVLLRIDYDDTPGARTVTTTSYSADVAADGTTSGPVRKTITRLDALGRAALSWRQLGADYSGVVVERNLRFDAMGRVLFSANPYPASGPPGLTDSSAFGTSYVYND